MVTTPIILKDGSRFSYLKQTAEIANPLGIVLATLQAYIVSENAEKSSAVVCALYRTKEGNWYDKNDEIITVNKQLLQQLKSAIDAIENVR